PVVDPVTGQASSPPPMSDTVDTRHRPLLEVHNLTTRFSVGDGWLGGPKARVHAVENVSFGLRAGETLALVGESGCGKSTTGRSIARLVEPMDGNILLEGKDILRMTKREILAARRQVQMIFQDPFSSLNPRMSVGAAIAEPMLFHRLTDRRDARARVAELLAKVGLDPSMSGRYPHEFSGGQRQRICIARVLALEPKLIIADEAVSALDVSVKAQVVNLLLDLQDKMGLAFLFISHDMAVVERVSHRVAVMYLGEIVEIGPRAAVFDNPRHPYTQKLIAAVPVPDPSVRRVRNAAGSGDIVSPIRALDYVPPTRTFTEVSAGHFVCDEIAGEPRAA
ncbi:MAG: ABC transporter ATP-binding protein, partial [Devosia sp.]